MAATPPAPFFPFFVPSAAAGAAAAASASFAISSWANCGVRGGWVVSAALEGWCGTRILMQ